MAQLFYKNLDGNNVASLLNFKLNPVSSDPSSPVTGVPWYNTSQNKLKYYDGSNIQVIANLNDLASYGRYRGAWDASTGIPTAAGSVLFTGEAIEAGDYWRVSAAGSISNLLGQDVLAPGDLIFADADGANTASLFFGVQANADLTVATIRQEVTLASLPASTATDVTPSLLSGGKIGSYLVLDSTGKDITDALDISVDQATPKITLTSLVALSNLSLSFVGTVSGGL